MFNYNQSSLEITQFKNQKTCQMTTFDQETKEKVINIPRGKRVEIGRVEGMGYISQLWLTFPGWFWTWWSPEDAVDQYILKNLIIRIYWEDEPKPAVEAPIADFFGIGLCHVANFCSEYFGMSSGGFFCKFPMIFRKSFRIEIENVDSNMDTCVFMNVLYQLTEDLPEDSGYFHAQFNTGKMKGTDEVLIAEASGRGHYVGCTLSMQSKLKNYLTFLESPEFVYVDNDWSIPRIVGTGLEDYMLGGWYFREGTFIGPYHGVTVKDALNSSISMYRIHVADAISFSDRLKFIFQNPKPPETLKPFCYSSVGFLYLDTPVGMGKGIPSAEDLMCWHFIKDNDHQSLP